MIKLVRFEDGELYERRGGTMRFVHWPGNGSRSVAVHYLRLEPGESFAEHVHDESVDVISVIEGEGELFSGDEVIPIRAGDSILVTPGTPHGARNTGTSTFVSIDVLTPPDPVMYAGLAGQAPSPEGRQ